MKFPLGDILRLIVKPASFLGRILSKTKGVSVKVGGHEIGLDQGHGPSSGPLERPHQPGPPRP